MELNPRTRGIWLGGIGAAVAALCCATPILVVLLGLGSLTGYLDYVLLPALVLFLGLLVYGLSGRRAGIEHSCCAEKPQTPSASNECGRHA